MKAVMQPVKADFSCAVIAFIKPVMKLMEKITQPHDALPADDQPFIS